MSNLLPPEQKQLVSLLYRKRIYITIMFAFFVVVLVGCLCLLPSLYSLRRTQAQLQEKYSTLSYHETSGVKRSLSSSVKDLTSRLSVFPESAPASPILGDLIDPVLAAKTLNIKIGSFAYTVDPGLLVAHVQVSGIASNRAALLIFIDHLKSVRSFSSVDVPIDSFIKDSNVPFTATLTAKVSQTKL